MSDRERQDRQITRQFNEARQGATPLRGYGEKHVNMAAARQAAARAGCSIDRVIDTVRKQGRHREF